MGCVHPEQRCPCGGAGLHAVATGPDVRSSPVHPGRRVRAGRRRPAPATRRIAWRSRHRRRRWAGSRPTAARATAPACASRCREALRQSVAVDDQRFRFRWRRRRRVGRGDRRPRRCRLDSVGRWSRCPQGNETRHEQQAQAAAMSAGSSAFLFPAAAGSASRAARSTGSAIEPRLVARVAGQQAAFGDHVDEAWHATRMRMQAPTAERENGRCRPPAIAWRWRR